MSNGPILGIKTIFWSFKCNFLCSTTRGKIMHMQQQIAHMLHTVFSHAETNLEALRQRIIALRCSLAD